jgi:hypothetical protein
MNALIGLCLALTGGFHRAPVTNWTPIPDTGAVWVYFTDKGIATEAAYSAAVRSVEFTASAETRARRQREAAGSFTFEDLPVREEYLRAVEELGARRRAVSRWLNAASFELPPALLPALRRMPFVHDVRPVARERHLAAANVFTLPTARKARSRAVDSVTANRFYGASFDQAYMMGIPDLFYRGWYGTGVRLAMFDSGLRLDNLAVRDLRIRAQHDFLSGDNCFSAAAEADWQPRAADRLRFLGLAKDPATTTTGSGILVTFCADSFLYAYGSPRRAIFASTTTDRGATWSEPEVVVISAPASRVSFNTFENLRLADAGFATYLSYGDISYSLNAGLAGIAWLSYRRQDTWLGAIRLGPGRWPDLVVRDSNLLVAWVADDSTVAFRSGVVSENLPYPAWTTQSVIPVPEALGGLALAADDDGNLVVVVAGRTTGRLHALRSTDGGVSWTTTRDIAAATPTGFRLAARGPAVALFYKDTDIVPFTRLAVLRSTDLGASWTAGPTITDNTLTVGGLAAAWHDGGLDLLYESAGFLRRTTSTDAGLTWRPPVVLDTAGFCYQPCLTSPDGSFAAWFKRGDDNAVWEPADTARFSLIQPDHGTRMASIIAGYSPTMLIGVAPGVELMIARTELHRTAGGRDYEFDLEEDTYIEALEWAEREGADIVSTSLGYRGWYTDAQMDGRTAPISIAASLAARRGIIIVTAMGNRDTTRYPFDRPYIVAPADAEGVIAAGGVQRDGSFWRGTGTGPTADGRPKPELVALSDTVAVVDPDTVTGLEGSVGTSCATALIAGAFALLREAHPDWPADSLKAAMFRSAGRSAPSCTFGFGVPRVDEAFRLHPPDKPVQPLPADHIQAFPNPYISARHDRVWFQLELARPTSRPGIRIYSASGALVDSFSLNPGPMGRPGRYSDITELETIGAFWDGLNLDGKPVAAGLYLAVLHTTFGQAIGRFAVIR